jgi:glycerol uptake facilitator-like aquaporin
MGTMIRLFGEFMASLVGFSFLHGMIPISLIKLTRGPELGPGVDMLNGALVEGLISFAFALTVLLASDYLVEPELCRPLFAIVLRVLIQIAGPFTGANMNSMIGFSWALYTGRLYLTEYQVVYSIAPLIGGLVAALAYYAFIIISPEIDSLELKSKLSSVVVEKEEEKEEKKVSPKKEAKKTGLSERKTPAKVAKAIKAIG